MTLLTGKRKELGKKAKPERNFCIFAGKKCDE
jgi:hypothetical protein